MIQKFNNIGNAFILLTPSFKMERILEKKSMELLINKINEAIPHNEDYTFFLFWGLYNEEDLLISEIKEQAMNKHNILFWMGDEYGHIPHDKIFKIFNIVFKVHLIDKYAINCPNHINEYRSGLFHLPLLTPDDVPTLPIIPYEQRKYNLYFCGNLSKTRYALYHQLRKRKLLNNIINWYITNNIKGSSRLYSKLCHGKSFDMSSAYPNSYIHFYSGFNNGADYNTYAWFLQQSKIALSPRGFVSPECFRFYEAMRQGCIVITEKLPKSEFYNNAPCITVSSWKELPTILADKERIASFSPEKIRAFYDERLSVRAIAEYVVRKILQNL